MLAKVHSHNVYPSQEAQSQKVPRAPCPRTTSTPARSGPPPAGRKHELSSAPGPWDREPGSPPAADPESPQSEAAEPRGQLASTARQRDDGRGRETRALDLFSSPSCPRPRATSHQSSPRLRRRGPGPHRPQPRVGRGAAAPRRPTAAHRSTASTRVLIS